MSNVLTINVRDATGNTVSVSTNDQLLTYIGAITGTPTSNTVMDRLITIDGSLNAMPSAQGQTTKSGSLSVTVASDDDTQAKFGPVTETAPATDTASSGLNGRLQRVAQRLTTLISQIPAALGQTTKSASMSVALASDDTLVTNIGAIVGTPTANTVMDRLKTIGTNTSVGTAGAASTSVQTVQGISGMTPVTVGGIGVVTCTTSFNRPANTTAYAAKQSIADSTTAPTAGGFTLTGVSSAAGKSGILFDVVITSSNPAATPLQGILYIFDSAITATNDGAALNISTSAVQTLVAIIPFTLASTAAASHAAISNLNIGFTTVGSANLRFCIAAANAYTPASGETITVRAKFRQNN